MEFIDGELVYYAFNLSPKLTNLKLIPISDVHFGDALFAPQHFERTLAALDAPDTFAILNGDLANCAIAGSKSDIYKAINTPQDQYRWLRKKLKPYAHKILGMTTGNHENRVYQSVGFDISWEIADYLNVPYRPTGMLIKVSFGDGNNRTKGKPYVYWIYFTHGYGGARTKSAKAVKVERLATFIHADCYIMGHDHVVNVAPDIYLIPDPRTHKLDNGFEVGRITAKRKMLVKSNAYLKWGGYGEMLGFPPVDLEAPIIKLAGEGKPRITVEI